jgi:hypothetical protein
MNCGSTIELTVVLGVTVYGDIPENDTSLISIFLTDTLVLN